NFIALTDIGTSPYPVMRMMGMELLVFANSAWKSRPLNLGNLTSSTMQLTTLGSLLSSKSAIEPKGLTLRPTELSSSARESRKSASSSTTNTVASLDPPRICTESCVTGHSPDMSDRTAKYRLNDGRFNFNTE